MFKKHSLWLTPLLLLLFITPFSSQLDLTIAKMAYSTNPECDGFFSTPFFDFVYIWGVVPAQAICFVAAIMLIASIWAESLRKYRSICLLLSVTLCLGSGFITNVVLKEHWGRPRPRQIVDFGGNEPFRAYYQPVLSSTPVPMRSFPSGHSTCGFYFFCFYFIGKRLSRPLLARFGIVSGLALGAVLSVARIIQGGHFMTDILISAIIMWLTCYLVDYLIFQAPLFSNFRKNFLSIDDIGLTKEPHTA